jgi:hypothetical protein
MPEWARERRSCPDCSTKKCFPGCQCGRHNTKKWERECERCGGKFMGRRKARYCSNYCRGRVEYLADPERAHDAVRRFTERNPGKYSKSQARWSMRRRASIRRELWDAQDGKCYLCGDPLPSLEGHGYALPHTDHDHACCRRGSHCEKCRRGLACRACNQLIGVAHDDPDRLRRIADNLERAKELVQQRMAEDRGCLF